MVQKFSVKSMAETTKKHFGLPMIFSVITFVLALAAIWIVPEKTEQEVSPFSAKGDSVPLYLFYAFFCGLCFSVVGTLLAEALEKVRFRSCFSAAGMLLGIGLYILNGEVSGIDACLILFLSAALLSCALIARGKQPQLILGRFIGCFILCGAVALLIFLILNLLLEAVSALFIQNYTAEVIDQLEFTFLAAAGLLAAPFLLFSFMPDQENFHEKDTKVRGILAWVILPAYLILLLLLLGYIVTMVISWELPVGKMNPYAVIALGTFTVLHLLLNGDENRLSHFFTRLGAILLLPVVITQFVAVYIRIEAYGLTQLRIYGIAFTAVCLIPVFAALMRRYGRIFFPVSTVLLVLLTVTPLNAETLARLNQENRLFSALEHADMLEEGHIIRPNENASAEDRAVIWASASYLNSSLPVPKGSRTEELLTQLNQAAENDQYEFFSKKAEKLFGFDDPDKTVYILRRIAEGQAKTDELDVAGFSHAKRCVLYFREKDDWHAEADGETLSLDQLLPLADFDHNCMTVPDILLPSGRTLRINYFERIEYTSTGEVYYDLSAWLMTP